MGIKSNVSAESSNLEPSCELQLCSLTNTKVKAANKDHGKKLHLS